MIGRCFRLVGLIKGFLLIKECIDQCLSVYVLRFMALLGIEFCDADSAFDAMEAKMEDAAIAVAGVIIGAAWFSHGDSP